MSGELRVSFRRLVRRFRADESGATAIEYALIAAGIGAAVIATVMNLGTTIKTALWDKIAGSM
jgi:pilus assembly protein Flp/PilA